MFKSGDKVVCVDASRTDGHLKEGEVYDVVRVDYDNYIYLKRHDDCDCNQTCGGWDADRFKKVEKEMEKLTLEEKARRYDRIDALGDIPMSYDEFGHEVVEILNESVWPPSNWKVGGTLFVDGSTKNGMIYTSQVDGCTPITVKVVIKKITPEYNVTVGYIYDTTIADHELRIISRKTAKEINLRDKPAVECIREV